MKVVLIGASGFVGTPLLAELLERGITVTAVVRDASKITTQNRNLTVKSADVFETDKLVEIIAGHDAVINAFNAGWTNPNLYNDFLKGSKSIQQAVKESGVKRLLAVGGAGSLYIGGGQLVDSPQFPAEYKAGATAARDYLNILRQEDELDWTFLSPAINLHPGTRTGKFRLGTEEPVFDENGKCEISVEDMAVAIADEILDGQFIKQRFTLGY